MNRQQIENSSNMVSAGYDPGTRKMHVEFKGGKVYEYDDVAPEKFSGFAGTFSNDQESSGAYFHREFKGQHEYRQV